MILSASVVLSAIVSVTFAADGGIATKHDTSLCVVPQQKPANGVPVVLAPCNGASSSWTFNTTGTNPMGTFQVTGTNQCLDVKDGVVANGTPLQTWECTTGDKNQQFVLINGTTIGWAGQGKCLDVKDGKFAPGTPLQIWDCTGGENQQFVYPTPAPPSSPPLPVRFKTTAHPDYCISADSDTDGAPLRISRCDKSTLQRFNTNFGYYSIGDKAIDLTNGDQTNGNKLQIWTYDVPNPNPSPNPNQRWTWDSNAITLNANPKKCIDVTDGEFTDGTRLQIWDCTGGPNQQFTREVDIPPPESSSTLLLQGVGETFVGYEE